MNHSIKQGVFFLQTEQGEIPMYFGLYAMRMMAKDLSEESMTELIERLKAGQLGLDDINTIVRYSIIHGISKTQIGVKALNEGAVWDLLEADGLDFGKDHWVTAFMQFCVDSIGVKFKSVHEGDASEKKSH